ncbi:MAG: tetratricopeptide repeat protein [Candidatus Krumholzibacteriota bacterium]
MEMGYFEEAEASLASARATIDFLSGKDRKEAIRNYSVGKSWFHFEMGNWEDGLQWAEQAVKYKAGIEGYLLAGLNSAYSSKSFEELRKTTSGLRPLSQGGNRRQNLSWCYLLHFYFHDYLFDGTDAAVWLRKTTHHYQKDVSRWRDYGIYCEANQSAKLAVEYYSKSHRALRFKDGGWLTGMEHPIPPDRASPTVMPFWINADQEFVTGSLLAYMSYFQLQMATAESHAARHDLAARILTYANRTYRRYPDYPWVPLWLSEALLVLGQPLEAENTIEKARASFEALEITEPHLDRVHGHILLLRKNAGRAEPMVRRAVSRFPADGACWTDLGLVEVMSGNRTAAREAFDKALELDPGLVTAWYNRGLMNMHEGLFEEAVSDIERANNLDPDDAEITGLLEQLKRILSR